MRYINLFRNLANAPLYLAVKFGLVSDDPLMFVTRTGVRVEVPRRLLQTFKEIFMDECYLGPVGLPEREGAVVVDIGANVGFFSLFCAARLRVPRIVAYEPFPANFAQLARNCRLNPMLNIYPYRCAVGGSRGEISLHYDADDTFSTSAAIGEAGGAGRDVIKVPCTTLAEIFATHEVKECDLLKLDCEGAEYDILYGSPREVLSSIARIAMEVHDGPQEGHNIAAMESFLQGAGFETFCRPVGMLWARRQGG